MRKAVESKQVKQQKPQEQPTREKLAGAEQQYRNHRSSYQQRSMLT